MTDTRSDDSPSVIDRTHEVAAEGIGHCRVFSRPHRGFRSLAKKRSCWRRRMASRSGSARMAARSSRPHPTASAWSPAATTARSSPPMPKAKAKRWRRMPSTAGSIRSRSRPTAPSPGPPAKPLSCKPRRRAKNFGSSRRRRRSAASRSCPRAFAWRSRITTARRCGSPMRRKPTPEKLEWKGSHLGVTVSPDGRFLVTSMQEPMLHGWRLADSQHMRMSGYSSRVTSLGWTVGGRFLATSGSTQVILWPFHTKDGPMGKQPRLLAPSEHRVGVVACHPKQDIIAAGYDDGMVLLVRDRGRRRDPGQAAGRRAGHRARLERRRHLPRLRHRKRRSRYPRSDVVAVRSHIAAAAGSR